MRPLSSHTLTLFRLAVDLVESGAAKMAAAGANPLSFKTTSQELYGVTSLRICPLAFRVNGKRETTGKLTNCLMLRKCAFKTRVSCFLPKVLHLLNTENAFLDM